MTENETHIWVYLNDHCKELVWLPSAAGGPEPMILARDNLQRLQMEGETSDKLVASLADLNERIDRWFEIALDDYKAAQPTGVP